MQIGEVIFFSKMPYVLLPSAPYQIPLLSLHLSPLLCIYMWTFISQISTSKLKVINFKMTSLFFLVFLFSSLLTPNVDASPIYIEALSKSLLFFHGQRSGPLPTDQQFSWRASSGLSDGSSANVHPKITKPLIQLCYYIRMNNFLYDLQVDLVGGYYTEGDNVKHNFPMAFTTTMLSWSTLEYGEQMGLELQNARVNIRSVGPRIIC